MNHAENITEAQPITIAESLQRIPAVSIDQWRASGQVARWLIVSRAPVLVMTFSAVAVAGALALLSYSFDWMLWVLCLLGALLAHAAHNQLNDLTDSVRGIDTNNYLRRQYGVHVLEDGLVSRKELVRYIILTGAMALFIGLLVTAIVGPMILVPMAIGTALALSYSFPLKQFGMGEVAVWVTWGPLLVAGTYVAMAGVVGWQVAVIGTLYGLGPTTVIFGKHIDKIDADEAIGMRTLPVRLGSRWSRYTVLMMTASQYVGVAGLVLLGQLPSATLITFLALPQALRLARVFREDYPAQCPEDYPEGVWPLWYTAAAFAHARSHGLLLLTGLLCAILIDRLVPGVAI